MLWCCNAQSYYYYFCGTPYMSWQIVTITNYTKLAETPQNFIRWSDIVGTYTGNKTPALSHFMTPENCSNFQPVMHVMHAVMQSLFTQRLYAGLLMENMRKMMCGGGNAWELEVTLVHASGQERMFKCWVPIEHIHSDMLMPNCLIIVSTIKLVNNELWFQILAETIVVKLMACINNKLMC